MTELTAEQTNDITRLIQALESGKYEKAKGFFHVLPGEYSEQLGGEPALDDEYCCLGVYCEVNGISYRPSQGSFYLPPVWPAEKDLAVLPGDHWLATDVETFDGIDDDGEDMVETLAFQNILARVNDSSETFEPVIKALRDFLNGKREFS